MDHQLLTPDHRQRMKKSSSPLEIETPGADNIHMMSPSVSQTQFISDIEDGEHLLFTVHLLCLMLFTVHLLCLMLFTVHLLCGLEIAGLADDFRFYESS